jgi:diaminopimelate decarboxylase
VYRKHSGGKEIVITDAAMNDLIRPALYDAYHNIEAVGDSNDQMIADIAGPICESGDFFGRNRDIAEVRRDDLLVLRNAGAYGFVMASNYNSRRRAAEVVVDGARFAVATRRESYEEMVQLEAQTLSWREP